MKIAVILIIGVAIMLFLAFAFPIKKSGPVFVGNPPAYKKYTITTYFLWWPIQKKTIIKTLSE